MSHHTAVPGLSAQLVLPHEDAAESQGYTQRAYGLEAALMALIAAGDDAKPATPDQRIAAYMLSKPGDALANVLRDATAAERAFYRALQKLKQIAAARADVQVFSNAYEQPLQNAQAQPVVSREAMAEVPHAPDLKPA